MMQPTANGGGIYTPEPLNAYHYEGEAVWSAEELRIFGEGVRDHGKNWKLIQSLLATKTLHEVIEHYYYFKATAEYKPLRALMRLRQQQELKRMEQEGILMCDSCGTTNTIEWHLVKVNGRNSQDWCDNCHIARRRRGPAARSTAASSSSSSSSSVARRDGGSGGGGGGGGGGASRSASSSSSTAGRVPGGGGSSRSGGGGGGGGGGSICNGETAAGNGRGVGESTGMHECHLCGKVFQMPNSLYGHMRVHAEDSSGGGGSSSSICGSAKKKNPKRSSSFSNVVGDGTGAGVGASGGVDAIACAPADAGGTTQALAAPQPV
jgi:hypothetical protein